MSGVAVVALTSTSLSPPGVSLPARDKTLAGRGQAPLPASPGATGSTA
jgi:hypothetical protein